MFIFAHLNLISLLLGQLSLPWGDVLLPKPWRLILCWGVHMHKYCLVAKVTGYWVYHLTEQNDNLLLLLFWPVPIQVALASSSCVCLKCLYCVQDSTHCNVGACFSFSGQGAFGIIWGAQGLQFSERQCYWPLKGLRLLRICGPHNYRCCKLHCNDASKQLLWLQIPYVVV